jgi:uncharacterized protein YjbJ (UPF0337 family)
MSKVFKFDGPPEANADSLLRRTVEQSIERHPIVADMMPATPRPQTRVWGATSPTLAASFTARCPFLPPSQLQKQLPRAPRPRARRVRTVVRRTGYSRNPFSDPFIPKRQEALMNWDRVEGNWKQLKGNIKEQWGELTDDDIDVINGRREQLAGRLQETYGISKDEAERQVKDWESSLS